MENKNYLLRDIPAEVWLDARHKAINEGISMRLLIIRLLKEYGQEIERQRPS